MTNHPSYEELNDFVDALLSAAHAATIRQHVDACPECGRIVQGIAALHESAGALPREMQPPPQVWAGIRAATVEKLPPQRSLVLWHMRYQLAAAALVLLVVASSVTWWMTRSAASPRLVQSPAVIATPHPQLAAYRQVEANYIATADQLKTLLQQRRGTMDTTVVRTVEENLRIMDDAIERARAALMTDQSNQDIAGVLGTVHESRIRMLNRAVRMGAT